MDTLNFLRQPEKIVLEEDTPVIGIKFTEDNAARLLLVKEETDQSIDTIINRCLDFVFPRIRLCDPDRWATANKGEEDI